MGNTIGTFDYSIIKMAESDPLPVDPIVFIDLRQWTTNGRGAPRLSPDLMAEGEIDAYIQLLKEDLDHVGRNAKVALAHAKESTRQIVRKRVAAHGDEPA